MRWCFGAAAAIGCAVLLLTATPAGAQVRQKAVPPPVEVPVMVHGVLNQANLVVQLTERSRPYLNVEYHFLRTVCALSDDERKTLATAAEQAFQEAIAHYDEMRRTPGLRPAGAQPRALPDPRRLIQEGLLRVAEKHLSPERAARYREELAARNVDRKRVAIKRLIESLDHELFLSRPQREELATSLFTTWDETLVMTDLMVLYPERYLAALPRQKVARVLDAEQMKLWDQLLRNAMTTAIFAPTTTLVNDFPEDEELAAARAAGVRAGEVSP
jgi:hypothetical protein